MNDHDLDDLVIDTAQIKTHPKTKNPLTLFALVIIILILGIIFNNNFHQDSDNSDLLEENMSDFIAPELQLQNSNSQNLSTLEGATDDKIASPEEVSVETLIAQRPKTPLDRMQVIEMPIPRKQRTATEETKPVKEELAKTIDEGKEEEKQPVTVEKVIEKKVEKEPEPKPKKVVVEKKPKPVEVKPTRVKPIETMIEAPREPRNSKSYYIQVGAFKSTPSKRLLSVITSTGFKYVITEPNGSGTKKLLIGPYRDKSSAKKALSRVQTRIQKSAYVIQK
jgi:cell division protein FtsN